MAVARALVVARAREGGETAAAVVEEAVGEVGGMGVEVEVVAPAVAAQVGRTVDSRAAAAEAVERQAAAALAAVDVGGETTVAAALAAVIREAAVMQGAPLVWVTAAVAFAEGSATVAMAACLVSAVVAVLDLAAVVAVAGHEVEKVVGATATVVQAEVDRGVVCMAMEAMGADASVAAGKVQATQVVARLEEACKVEAEIVVVAVATAVHQPGCEGGYSAGEVAGVAVEPRGAAAMLAVLETVGAAAEGVA